jgi:hypothetical protein
MLKLADLFAFMENNFDYLLVVDNSDAIVHASRLFSRDASPSGSPLKGRILAEIITPTSLNTFKSAMAQAHAGGRGIAVFSPIEEESISIPLKAGYIGLVEGEAFVFFSNKLMGLSARDEWEKDERAKELSCLYGVAELIEVSRSINEFFTKLPRYLSMGMLYPEEVVVFSTYQGVDYGQKPASDNYLSVRLVVGKEDKGEIRVGYLDDTHELLPEEQKMLDEIGRMLNLALERKEFRDRLALKRRRNTIGVSKNCRKRSSGGRESWRSKRAISTSSIPTSTA